MCTQPIVKQNHVFLKISIRKKERKFRILENIHKKNIYMLNSYSAYLHNQHGWQVFRPVKITKNGSQMGKKKIFLFSKF